MSDSARTIGGRIREVRGPLSQGDFASRLAVHEQTLGKYERDKRLPDADFLTRLHNQFGVSIDWLLTGNGPMYGGPAPTAEAVKATKVAIDADLYGRVAEAVEAVHRDCGFSLSTRQIGSIAAQVYEDLVNAGGSRDEMLYGLRVMIERLRRELRDAINDPGGAVSRKDRA